MAKICELCRGEIEEEFNKLKGTMLRMVEDKKARFIFVCNECQKDAKWIEKAKIKGA